LGLLLGGLALYMVVIPAVWSVGETWFVDPNRPAIRRLDDDISYADWFRLKSVEMAMAMIFFAIGASIGSFLNVVIYRLPNRVPLFLRRSRCPHCQHAIVAKDNLPLIGWLRLGGRCRHCQAPISLRYPLIEGLVGGMFLLLFSVQLISGGVNLPNRTPNLYTGVVWVLFYTKWDLVGLYFYHCLLLSMLLVLGWVDYDRRQLSWRQILSGSGALAAVAIVFPGLLLWKFSGGMNPTVAAVWSILGGAALGAVVGWISGGSRGLVAGFAWVGIALGWQAVTGVAILSLWLRGMTFVLGYMWSARRRVHCGYLRTASAGTMWLLIAALLHHVLWRFLTVWGEPYWPGQVVNAQLLGLWATVFAGLLLANRAIDWGTSAGPADNAETILAEGS
jgi:leader peptidase (prepilin peptidase)/N-methyltransferase